MSPRQRNTPSRDENHSRRVSLSDVVERQSQLLDHLAGRRTLQSSATMKLSAQGVPMPEVTVYEGTEPAAVAAMVAACTAAFTDLLAAAQPRET